MPECPSRYKLARHAGGLTPEGEKNILEQHLKQCDDCRKTLAEIQNNAAYFDARQEDQWKLIRGALETEVEFNSSRANTAESVTNLANYSRTKLRIAVASLGLAAAAMIAILLLPGEETLPPLPEYALEASTGNLSIRGTVLDEQRAMELTDGTRIQLIARPVDAIQTTFAARAFALNKNYAAEIKKELKLDPAGSVALQGTIGQDIILPKDTTSMAIVVGYPGKLPTADQLYFLVRDDKISDYPLEFVILMRQVEYKAL